LAGKCVPIILKGSLLMGMISDFVESLSWSVQDFTRYHQRLGTKGLLDASSEDMPDAEVFLRHTVEFFRPQDDNVPRGSWTRFSGTIQPIDDMVLLRRAKRASNPYTKAIFLDYRYESLPRSRVKREAASDAALAYTDAVNHFATMKDPEDYWMACSDAIARAKQLFVLHRDSVDVVIDATLRYLGRIPAFRGVRIARIVALALTSGLKRTHSRPAKLADAFNAFWNRVNEARNDAAILAASLEPLAKNAGIASYGRRVAEVMAEAALSHGVVGNPIVAAGALHEAAKKARSVGSSWLGPLLKASDILKPALIASMDRTLVHQTPIDLRVLEPVVKRLADATSPDEALMLLGSETSFIPIKRAMEDGVRKAGPSLLEQITIVQPVGEHGAVGVSMEEVRIIQITDLWLSQRAALRRALFENAQIKHLFEPALLADFFVRAGLVAENQKGILLRGLEAWHQKDCHVAAAALLPIAENGFVACCSALGGEALAMSRSESLARRTGDAVAAMIEANLDENWAFFFRHVWAREGAIRHAYCHGFLTDDRVSIRESDLSISAMLSLAFYLFGKHAWDQWVRDAAYFNWLNRGCPPNDDWRDWFEAERLLGEARPGDTSQLRSQQAQS
jgi:hypothetical protein